MELLLRPGMGKIPAGQQIGKLGFDLIEVLKPTIPFYSACALYQRTVICDVKYDVMLITNGF